MSKSYDNTIPLFSPREQLKKLIAGIVTDSRAPGEPKEVEGSAVFQIYQAFAKEEETASLRKAYQDGIGWGDAKQLLFERIDREVGPMRAHYEALMKDPATIETTLRAGADKARELAAPFIRELRHAVGLRNLGTQAASSSTGKSAKAALPVFKQYREADGRFHFKLLDAKGQMLLQSHGFDSPKEAAQAIARLQAEGVSALTVLEGKLQAVSGVKQTSLNDALQQLQEARKAE